MARALLILGWLATAGLVVTGILGLQVKPEGGLGNHLLMALLSSLLILFSHCWILFYLIGTGKALKDAVARYDLDRAIVQQTRDFKNRSYPSLMLAIGFVMSTFIVGGGVATRVLPAWVHALLFGVTLVIQVRALLVEGEVLLANERLIGSVDQLVRDAGAGDDIADDAARPPHRGSPVL